MLLEDPETQAGLRDQDSQEQRTLAGRSVQSIFLRSGETLYELQKLAIMPEVREGSSPVRRLATGALKKKAELAVTKPQLHKALAAQKPAPTSRKVLFRARHATRRDMLNARHAREYAESGGRNGKGKGKAKQMTAAKRKGTKRAKDEDTVRLDDSEVERQVEELMRLDEEEEAGGPPEAALVREEERFGVDEEDISDAESSVDAVRRGPTHSCKGR
jgi:hypothetical protein